MSCGRWSSIARRWSMIRNSRSLSGSAGWARTSLTYALAIFPQREETLLTTGEVVQVYTDQRSHRPMAIPERVRAMYRAFEPFPEA